MPRELILLLEKYHKMYAILKCHRKWENEKMFGKSAQTLNFAGQANQDFQYFTSNRLVSKYTQSSLTSPNPNQQVQKSLVMQSTQAVGNQNQST